MEKHGHTVVVAGNGRKRWPALEGQPFQRGAQWDVQKPKWRLSEAATIHSRSAKERRARICQCCHEAHAAEKGESVRRCL